MKNLLIKRGLVAFGLGVMSFVSGCATTAAEKPIRDSTGSTAEPIYRCFDLVYNVSGISYESRLVMEGNTGYMRTRFFDPNIGKSADVGQLMKLGSSAKGMLIFGYNPVYYGTSIQPKWKLRFCNLFKPAHGTADG